MNIQKQLKKSEELLRVGQYEQAKKILEGIIKKIPQQFQAHGLLGLLYLLQDNYFDGEKHLKQSLVSNYNLQAAKNLTLLLIKQKRWQEAYCWSKKLKESMPNEQNLMLNHALILRNIGKANDALDLYENLIKKNPQNINLFISYGFTLNLLEKYEEAVRIYKQGLLLKIDDFSLLYNLGITYLNQFDYSNALNYLLLAQKKNKKSIDLLLTIAVCHAKVRNFDAAFYCVNEAKKIEPNNPLVPFQIGTLFLQQDKNQMAMQYFDEAINLEPNHIEANYHKGLVYLKEGKYKEALKYYRYRVMRKDNKLGRFNDFEFPIINKDSEIIVSWEQGIGDEILNMALVNHIKNKVKSITYITQDKLFDWFRLNLKEIFVIPDKESQAYIQMNSHKTKLNVASLMSYIDDWDFFLKHHSSGKHLNI